jgi:formylglycine-generating enzyme required for sulfatase activity
MVLGVLCLVFSGVSSVSAQTNVFNMGGTRDPVTGTWTGEASLEFVPVGNPGNAADTTPMSGGASGYGSVPYTYQMGKYDVTVGQYCQFLNAVAKTDTYGLYTSGSQFTNGMAEDYPTISITQSGSSGNYSYSVTGSYNQAANCPIFDVTWGDVARFCNWLQNGQPTSGVENASTTENGAYTLSGATSTVALMAVTRNAGATYVIPTENEWYKAAYYDPTLNGGAGGYWTYPTKNNAAPSNVLSATGTNNANYWNGGYTDPVNYLTPVGAFSASPSPYGTFDMGGDVLQWNETAVGSSSRGSLGGDWGSYSGLLASSIHGYSDPAGVGYFSGFRVAMVPEPGSVTLVVAGGLCLLACAWRRRRKLHNLPSMILAAMIVLAAGSVQADVFNMGGTLDPTTGIWTGQASLQFVPVGNPGNAADTATGSLYGSVPYAYQMGKYDVTVGQYAQFLNAVAKTDTYGLYNSYMATDYPTIGIAQSGTSGSYSYSVTGGYSQAANCPIFDVSWGDAARFCNWLQNGQPTSGVENASTTENGAYTLNGATSNPALMAITRNSGATYVIPSENEWYKAAYYDPTLNGGAGGYWTYPTKSNTAPSNVLSATGTNNANYYIPYYSSDPTNKLTPVGAFADSPGAYGTYDMGGDIYQWNEANSFGSYRGIRGGYWFNSSGNLASFNRFINDPTHENYYVGFRVASVPEPGSITLAVAGGLCLLAYAWRRRHVQSAGFRTTVSIHFGTFSAVLV